MSVVCPCPSTVSWDVHVVSLKQYMKEAIWMSCNNYVRTIVVGVALQKAAGCLCSVMNLNSFLFVTCLA